MSDTKKPAVTSILLSHGSESKKRCKFNLKLV